MSIEPMEITLDFDAQLTEVMLQYYDVKKVLKSLSEDDGMPDNQKAFYLENTLRHLNHFDRILTQAFRERS